MFTRKNLRRSLTGASIALAVLLAGAGQAMAQFWFDDPENLGPVVNHSEFDGGPSISVDGLTLFFASDRSGGSGSSDLWMTTRTSEFDPWELPVNLGPTVNSSSGDWAPSISTDGLTLFFQSNRPGGFGGADLWMTTRTSELDPWELPVNLGPTVNSSSGDNSPSISADGLTLFFNSTRPGGFGGADLWMTMRASEFDPWELPVNLGPTVNSSSGDNSPSISADGLTLFFQSNRPDGLGGADLWMTTRASLADAWAPPVPLPPPVNTSSNEGTPSISADRRTLFFRSDRPGGEGDLDLWQVAVTSICPCDINRDNTVDVLDLLMLLAAWDATGCPEDINGDGLVDVLDLLEVLAAWGRCPGVHLILDEDEFLTRIADGFYLEDFDWATYGGYTEYTWDGVHGEWGYTISAWGDSMLSLWTIDGAMATMSVDDGLLIEFSGAPVSAIGGWFYGSDFDGFYQPFEVTIEVRLEDSEPFLFEFFPTGPEDFRGFVSDVPIESILIGVPEVPPYARTTMDHFYVGAEVPR